MKHTIVQISLLFFLVCLVGCSTDKNDEIVAITAADNFVIFYFNEQSFFSGNDSAAPIDIKNNISGRTDFSDSLGYYGNPQHYPDWIQQANIVFGFTLPTKHKHKYFGAHFTLNFPSELYVEMSKAYLDNADLAKELQYHMPLNKKFTIESKEFRAFFSYSHHLEPFNSRFYESTDEPGYFEVLATDIVVNPEFGTALRVKGRFHVWMVSTHDANNRELFKGEIQFDIQPGLPY